MSDIEDWMREPTRAATSYFSSGQVTPGRSKSSIRLETCQKRELQTAFVGQSGANVVQSTAMWAEVPTGPVLFLAENELALDVRNDRPTERVRVAEKVRAGRVESQRYLH